MKCTLKYKSNDIVKVSFELNIVAKVIAEEKELVFLVDSGTIYNPKFETVDSKFKVIDEDLASYMLTQVVAGFKGMKGFGSGFQTGYRYFPAAVIVQNYLLIFDAALQ